MSERTARTLAEVLAGTEATVRGGGPAGGTVVPTGLTPLDSFLGGGLRAGELALLGGPQGLGKTTLSLQVARNAALGGAQVIYLCFEHDEVNLLSRLLALECGLLAGPTGLTLRALRQVLDDEAGAPQGLAARLSGHRGTQEGLDLLAGYADRLRLHRSSGRTTTSGVVRDLVLEARAASPDGPLVVFVDYLQKLAPSGGAAMAEEDRTREAAEALKDLALEAAVPIWAISAVNHDGLAGALRLRPHHLRGSTALAYEADVVLMMQEKAQLVARHHLVYGTSREAFRDWTVLSLEKNRSGLDKVDLEFRKHLDQARYDPVGQPVREQLVDERVYLE